MKLTVDPTHETTGTGLILDTSVTVAVLIVSQSVLICIHIYR